MRSYELCEWKSADPSSYFCDIQVRLDKVSGWYFESLFANERAVVDIMFVLIINLSIENHMILNVRFIICLTFHSCAKINHNQFYFISIRYLLLQNFSVLFFKSALSVYCLSFTFFILCNINKVIKERSGWIHLLAINYNFRLGNKNSI